MRASDVPIDELRQKYQADPGSLTVDEYEAITRYKKLIAGSTPPQVTPAKTDKPLTKAQKKKARKLRAAEIYQAKKRLKEPSGQILDSIFKKALIQIRERQEVDGKLSIADVKVMAEISKSEAIGKSLAATREIVQGSLQAQIQLAREEAFCTALIVMRTSKSGAERMHAAEFIKDWSDTEAVPEEPYTLAAADPSREKVININSAIA